MTILQPSKARVLTGESPDGPRWEIAEWEPAAALRPYVHDMSGYVEATRTPLLRRELPGPRVVVILEFGPPIQVFEKSRTEQSSRFRGGFVAGLNEGCTFTRHDGRQQGIQLNLTPIGARLFFDIPASELAHRVIEFGDLVPEHRNLCERLADADDWDTRFEMVEQVLLTRITGSRADERVVQSIAWFCGAIAHGATDMGVLADHLGYSHKHVIALFREYTGLPPKTLARLHRFDRLVQAVKRGSPHSWAELALEHGYYDQSHLARDMGQFAGISPTGLSKEFHGR